MKTIDKLIEKGKKKVIIPLAFLTALTLAKEARTENKGFFTKLLDRTSIEANYSCGWPKLNKEFLKQYSNSFAMPYFRQYLEQSWQDFEQAKNLQTTGAGVNVKIYENKDKKLSVDIQGGWGQGKAKVTYDKTYTANWPYYGKGSEKILREEETKITKPYLGIKLTKELSNKVNVSGSLNADFYDVKGNTNLTWSSSLEGFPNYYKQWRQASYSGKATGFSGEVDLTYKLGKNVALGAGVGYTNAKVSTSGKEIKTASTNPGMSWEYDHNPSIDLSGINGKVEVNVSFK